MEKAMSGLLDQISGYMHGKWLALVVALGGFIGFTTSHRRTVNGVVVEDVTLNYGALIAGPIAVGLAVMLALKISKQEGLWGNRGAHYAVLAGIAAIGVYHFLTSGFFF